MPLFSLKKYRGFTTIYINNLPHLKFRTADFIGVESYREPTLPEERMRGFAAIKFTVHWYFRSGTSIACEYDKEEKWLEVLKLIDSKLP